MGSKDPLEGWKKTILKFGGDGLFVTTEVLYPPDISNNAKVKLLEKNASQGERIIRQLTGSKAMIIQGQFEEMDCDQPLITHKELTEQVSKCLNKNDPMKLIKSGCPSSEYDSEKENIIPKMTGCKTLEQLHEMIFAEFKKMFNDTINKDVFKSLADDLWKIKQKYNF